MRATVVASSLAALVTAAASALAQTGACCLPSGACSVTTSSSCTSGGGTYLGDGTECGLFNGAALRFDGQDDYVEVPDNGTLAFSAGQAITIEAWVRPSVTGGARQIVARSSDITANYSLRLQGNGQLAFFYRGASEIDWFEFDSAAGVAPVGQWTHVAVTHVFGDGVQTQFYINGQPVTGGWGLAPYEGPAVYSEPLIIGAIPLAPASTPVRVFGGDIDEVQIWNVYRSAADIASSFFNTVSGSETGLVAAWHLDEGAGTSAADATSNGNVGTVNGAAWIATRACGTGVGACCLPTGACQVLSRGVCAAQGGTFRGNDTTCSGTDCPQPGACCLPDGRCLTILSTDCAALGGAFQGNFTLCAVSDGFAARFDGADDIAAVPDNGSLAIATGEPITVEAWIYPFNNGTVLCKGSDITANYALRRNPDGSFDFYYRGVSEIEWFQYTMGGASPAPLNQWTHVALTHVFGDPNQVQGYMNGLPVAGAWTSNQPYEGGVFNAEPLTIGALAIAPGTGPTRVLNGYLDDVRVWRTVRTAEQIANAFSAAVPANAPGLEMVIRFDEGAGTIAADATANNNDAEMIGAGWATTRGCGAGIGSCCLPTGGCIRTTRAFCITYGGTYGGDGSTCIPNTCPQPGACCLPDGQCVSVVASQCAALGGTFRGDSTLCGDFTYSSAACASGFEDISATGVLGPACDDCGPTVPLGFAFPFYGGVYTQISMSSDGYLTFSGDVDEWNNDVSPNLPSTESIELIIAPMWDDWRTDTGGAMYSQSFGDRFVAQWSGVNHFDGNATATFQAILYSDGRIDFRYGTFSLNSPTIGVEDGTGMFGLFIDPFSIAQDSCLSLTAESDGACGCRADFDGDGFVTGLDFDAFVAAFEAGDPSSDFDGDGFVTGLDFDAYVGAFEAGC